jgi:hypothetical protein
VRIVQEQLGRRQRWAGVAVSVGGLMLATSLIWPWLVVTTGVWSKEGFFLIFWHVPAWTWIVPGTLGVLAVLAGAWSALGRGAPRSALVALGVLFLAEFGYVAWEVAQLRRLGLFGEVIALPPFWGLLVALAGSVLGAAGSLMLARAKRP